MKKASNKWYFTKETNAKGLCYIYAYQTQWDPVAKKSKRSARKYVGRLAADSVVNITAKFRTEFPQYAQGTFYFGLDKTLAMRQPTAEIFRTLPALNQRLPKWIQLCGIPAAWGSLGL